MHQAARDLELALLAAADSVPAGWRRRSASTGNCSHARLEPLDAQGALAAVAPRAQAQVHLDGEVRKDARALGEIGDAVPSHLVRPRPRAARPAQADLALPRGQEAEQHLQQGRLAGAVGAEHAARPGRASPRPRRRGGC